MKEPILATHPDRHITARRSVFGAIAAWILGVFIATGVVGIGIAMLRDDGFFALGFIGVYAAALFIALPASAIAASVSLIRHEPSFGRSLTVLLLSLLILALGGSFAYRWLTTPLRLFQ